MRIGWAAIVWGACVIAPGCNFQLVPPDPPGAPLPDDPDDGPPDDGTTINQPPVAVIDGPESATVGDGIVLDGSGSFDPDGEIVAFVWDIGGSELATEPTAGYTVVQPGEIVITLTVTDDIGESASETLIVTARPEPVTLSVVIEPPGAGTVSLDPPGGVYEPGERVTLQAAPSEGFAFDGYFDAGSSLANEAATWTFDVAADTTVLALFASVNPDPDPPPPPSSFTVSVQVDPPGGGTVTLDPPGGVYEAGTEVELVATAANGYVFTGYAGDLSSSRPAVSVVVDSDLAVQAVFEWLPALGNPGNLLVTGFVSGSVLEFDRFTGELLGAFAPADADGPAFAGDIGLGPNGDAYVVDVGVTGPTRVLRFNGTSGESVGAVVTGASDLGFLTLAFGPGGNLFVPDSNDDSIGEYTADGAFVRTLVASGAGGLDGARGLAFGPSGSLFVVSSGGNEDPDEILEFDGTTGEFVRVVADLSAAGFPSPLDLLPDGNGGLFVSVVGNDSAVRVDIGTGDVEPVIASGSGGLDTPGGLVFHPDTGALLVVSQGTDEILEFDAETGAFIRVFAASTGGESLFFAAFRPQ